MPSVAEFANVSKDYTRGLWGNNPIHAVAEVTLRIEPGEVFGLLGPNRAGKTTLVKLLLSLCTPTGGKVLRLGEPISDRSTLAKVGYVHENQAFPRYLSAREILEYYGALALLTEDVVKARADKLLERVGLADRAHEPISRFSKGMAQRFAIAQALINDPELLVLDEPNEGLDLVGRQMVRDVVAEQRSRGRTVILVSHVLTEVEHLCDRIGVIRLGRLAYLGLLADLLKDPQGGPPLTLEKALERLYSE